MGINFELIKHIGVLSEGTNGWKTELNVVSWNEKDAKYDIRAWNADRSKCSKGITLSMEEMSKLKQILNNLPKTGE